MGLTCWVDPLLVLAGVGLIIRDKRGGQCIQPLIPELFVVPQPFDTTVHGARIQLAGVVASLNIAYHQPGALQYFDVFGNGRERHIKGCR